MLVAQGSAYTVGRPAAPARFVRVALGTDRRLRVRLAADYERLEFLRVLRHLGSEIVADPGGVVAPAAPAPG